MLKIVCKDTELAKAATAFADWLKIEDGVVIIRQCDLSGHGVEGMDVDGMSACTIENVVFILIDDLAPDHISTLAHEMVHAQQYLSGRLGVRMSHWEGHEIDVFNAFNDLDAYKDRPWEAEAFALQDKLARRYNRSRLWNRIKSLF